MSSDSVRTEIKSFVTTGLPLETFIDLSGEFADIQDVISNAGLTSTDPWIGIQFIGNSEEPITVASDYGKGKFREMGGVMFHIVDIAKLGVANDILPRAEALRNLLRGRRIGDIVIESVSPPNFGDGASLNFEGGYSAATVIVSYEYDFTIA